MQNPSSCNTFIIGFVFKFDGPLIAIELHLLENNGIQYVISLPSRDKLIVSASLYDGPPQGGSKYIMST